MAPSDDRLFQGTQKRWVDKTSLGDIVAIASKAALSLRWPTWAPVWDFLVTFIPNQRIDRVQDFMESIAERVDDVEAFKTRVENSPTYACLFEEATALAVRTPIRPADVLMLMSSWATG